MHSDLRILTGNAHPTLAKAICKHLGVTLTPAEVFQFSNENIFVRLLESIRGKDTFIIQPFSSPVNDHIMELLVMLDTCKRASAGHITAVIPYYSYGRSDKKDQPRVPITARLLADMIEIAGADRWVTIDLHAGQIQGFYKIPGDSLTALHIICKHIRAKNLNGTVVTTDLGFAKGGRNYAEALGFPLAFVEKRRVGAAGTREALTLIGSVAGRDVLIVDDLVDTAGSVQQAVEIVRAHGAGDVYLAFTHAVLSPPAIERLGSLGLKEIITTDTLPVAPNDRLPNMTVLTVAELLGEVIIRSHEGRSVGELFNE